MTKLLYTVGPANGSGFGLVPIPWSEIRAWRELTGSRLLPWQAEALVLMSRAYAGEFNSVGREKGVSTPPWSDEETTEKRKATVGEVFARGLDAMAGKAG